MAQTIEPSHAGCWIDGGQYTLEEGNRRVVEIAQEYGYEPKESADLDESVLAENWLNEHATPEDHSFGWFEGDFMLWSKADWNTAYGDMKLQPWDCSDCGMTLDWWVSEHHCAPQPEACELKPSSLGSQIVCVKCGSECACIVCLKD